MERDSEYIKGLIKMAEDSEALVETETSAIKALENIGTVEAMDALFYLGLQGDIQSTSKRFAIGVATKLRSQMIESGRYEDSSKGLIDKDLHARCAGKDYHDVANNAFPILEDRIRDLLGLDREMHGLRLIEHALNPKTGKLSIGDTKAEKEGIYLLFRGAIGFLRNPPSHTMKLTMGKIEAHNLMCFVDLLLKFLKRAKKVGKV